MGWGVGGGEGIHLSSASSESWGGSVESVTINYDQKNESRLEVTGVNVFL